MSQRVSWTQAEDVAKGLSAAELWILRVVLRLPLAPVALLVSLHTQARKSSLYELVARLEELGLLGAVRPAISRGLSPRLLYLTDLGLATLALLNTVDVEALAREHRVRRSDLLRLLPKAGTLVGTYELLGAIALSGGGPPALLAWERPWVRRYQSPTARALIRVTIPAYAEVAWREGEYESEDAKSYLLMPDRARFPIRVFRRAIDQLLVLRATRYPDIRFFPSLVVGVPDEGRAHDWRELLEAVRAGRAEAPLRARILARGVLQAERSDLHQLPAGRRRTVPRDQNPIGGARQAGLEGKGTVPAIVGDLTRPLARDRLTSAQVGRLALGLTRQAYELLDLIGRHPFLTAEETAVFLGCSRGHALRRQRRLIRLGLARVVEREEVRRAAERLLTELGLVELTRAGLWLLAADHGLSLATAVRECGLSGGGMDDPIGERKGLIACLEHTLGVNAIFVALARAARHKTSEGGDEALVEWRNAHACRDGYLYPDGYGCYRRSGQFLGFFVEYDRGTERTRDYIEKLRAYHYYSQSRRFERRYDGFPTILFVTKEVRSEERIARIVRALTSRYDQSLPILVTSEEKLTARGNHLSIVGRICQATNSSTTAPEPWPTNESAKPPDPRVHSPHRSDGVHSDPSA